MVFAGSSINNRQAIQHSWKLPCLNYKFNFMNRGLYKTSVITQVRKLRDYPKKKPKKGKKKSTITYMPITLEKPTVELVNVTQDMKSFKAYDKLCIKHINELHIGTRMRKAAEAEKEEK
ncbi:hypothetical protein WN944_003480 [Citrus x changshan-huyou]|uniref:Uncharacterized protein n=1 Tax=Citrus x changshan-huyou TaxID=2935761 RepID=A0AAP0M1H2_9ROSI